MSKKTYWSVFDTQTGDYMASGRNSPSLKQAVEDLWEYWIGGTDLEEKEIKKMEKWDWKKKKNWLEFQEFRFERHENKLGEVI
jgi:hypothetical protein